MKALRFLAATACIAASISLLSSCIKKDFDAPADESHYDPQLHVTTTIAQLLAMNGPYSATGDDTTLITNDSIVISGIVTANDASGNLYKQIIIQDSTAAIQVLATAYSLYGNYPVGRKVYIKCKGLILGYDGGTPVLGGSLNEQAAVQGIAGTDIEKTIIKADVGHTVPDTVVTLAQVKSYQSFFVNRLITIKDVEFENDSLSYTDPTATTNRYIEDCSNSSLVVRTSNYANFHAATVPHGKGTITGIYTVYTSGTKNTPQLLIRDTTDVKFTGYRCGEGPITPGVTVSIDSLRTLFVNSGATSMPLDGYAIAGVVISDAANKNVSTGNVILQSGNSGIVLYFGSATNTPTYVPGDSLLVNLSGLVLTQYNGAYEIKTVAENNVTKFTGGHQPDPKVVTLTELNSNPAKYESILVKINNATLSGGTTYSGSKTITDNSSPLNTYTLYTAGSATFSGNSLPTTPVSITGIVTPYQSGGVSTPELKMRNASDVQ